jgi:bifunctional non-homologous end joining protein LigD
MPCGRRLYAFDLLASDGEDLRALPLALRKTKLARLLRREVEGISSPSTSNVTSDLFHAACKMGLEGILSKRLDRGLRCR